jgi:hypothetical protein
MMLQKMLEKIQARQRQSNCSYRYSTNSLFATPLSVIPSEEGIHILWITGHASGQASGS